MDGLIIHVSGVLRCIVWSLGWSDCSGRFWTPSDLQFQARQPLMAAMVEMLPLRKSGFMPFTGGLGDAVVVFLVAKALAGHADHQGSAWSQVAMGDGRPGIGLAG